MKRTLLAVLLATAAMAAVAKPVPDGTYQCETNAFYVVKGGQVSYLVNGTVYQSFKYANAKHDPDLYINAINPKDEMAPVIQLTYSDDDGLWFNYGHGLDGNCNKVNDGLPELNRRIQLAHEYQQAQEDPLLHMDLTMPGAGRNNSDGTY